MSVNFSKYKKEFVLLALWKVAKDAPFFELEGIQNEEIATLEKAKSRLERNDMIFDFCGRLINTKLDNLSKTSSLLFDRDNGRNAMQKALQMLSNKEDNYQENITYS